MNTTAANPQGSSQATSYPGAGRPGTSGPGAGGAGAGASRPSLPLYRPAGDRMLAGVASGIARYLDADVSVVRIVLAVLALVGGVGVPLYLAGWLLIPEEGRDQSLASELIESLQGRQR